MTSENTRSEWHHRISTPGHSEREKQRFHIPTKYDVSDFIVIGGGGGGRGEGNGRYCDWEGGKRGGEWEVL